MRGRRGPSTGYDAGIKRQYRRNVWATFKRNAPVSMSEARVLMLPSSEGDEISVAFSSGARPRNITICDQNAALVATLKRRPEFAGLNAWGVPVEIGLWEREYEPFHLINLDLCSTVDGVAGAAAVASLSVTDNGLVAVTWQKGRDKGVLCNGRPVIGESRADLLRLIMDSVLQWLCPNAITSIELLRSEQYRLSVVPMEWAVFRISRTYEPDEPHRSDCGPPASSSAAQTKAQARVTETWDRLMCAHEEHLRAYRLLRDEKVKVASESVELLAGIFPLLQRRFIPERVKKVMRRMQDRLSEKTA